MSEGDENGEFRATSTHRTGRARFPPVSVAVPHSNILRTRDELTTDF